MAVHAGRFQPDAFLRVVRGTADRLNHLMDREQLRPGELTAGSRELLAWFRHFADAGAIEAYAAAVGRAQSVWRGLRSARLRWRGPLLVHYRPSHHLYRWRVLPEGTRVVLNTPMIAFDAAVLRLLGRQIAGDGPHPAVSQALLAPGYQALYLRLESSGGMVERAGGRAHDLSAAFERVNRIYFAGGVARPRLTWSRRLTGRKFGHYDYARDTVMISRSLDSPRVPAFVVDHVMHHELLHKRHGLRWRAGRRHSHTPEFRAAERQFADFPAADAFLNAWAAAGQY